MTTLADTTPAPTPGLYPPTVAPAREGLPAIAYLAKTVVNPLRGIPERAYTEPVVHYKLFGSDMAWVGRPDLIERVLLHDADTFIKSPMERRVLGPTLGDGLLTASGAAWKWQRKIAAPLFRHGDVLGYVPVMAKAADAELARWLARSGARKWAGIVDVQASMKAATFDVIANTILAGCDAREAAIIQRADKDFMNRTPWAIAATVAGLPPWMWYPAKGTMTRASRDLRAAVLGIVQRRRTQIAASGRGADDILGRLLAARHPDTGEPMSDERLVDNITTFLEAGHQTTALALTWSLYLLARAPEWQDRVRAEVTGVAGGLPIGPEHMDALPVTLRVLKESMRLYPPAPVMLRQATQACTLGDVALPKDTNLMISIYVVHRHRALWADPDRFDPDRFLPEREQQIPRGQYIPFGFGPRTCLGMPFALVEGLSMLATLIRGARFATDGQHVPEPVSQVTLAPRGGMPLSVTLL
jgi:cytochrome P450